MRWPLERTLIATVPEFEDVTRSPLAEIADDYRKPGSDGCKLWLAPWLHLSGATKRLIVSTVASRLGIEDPQARWTLHGPQPSVIVRPRAAIPAVIK